MPHRRPVLSLSLATALGAALTAVTAVPASASSASVEFSGQQLIYVADPGEINDVTVTQTGPGAFTVTDLGAIIVAGQGCTGGGSTVTCSEANATNINVRVELGDGDDAVTVNSSVVAYLYGGAGDDTLTATSNVVSVLYGEAGDDTITGGPGDDYLNPGDGTNIASGGDGNDTSYDEGGDDTIDMGAGNDTVYSGDGNDDVRGGTGIDSLSYGAMWWFGNIGDVTVSLDDVANDSEAGKSGLDNFHSDIEKINTGYGNDTITGSGAANIIFSGSGDDTIDGAGGRDNLDGGYGADILTGGPGNDRLNGQSGDDVVNGGDGDDYFDGGDFQGRDTFSGGPGVDFVAFNRESNVVVTLDDQPNDGDTGEGDNVMADMEDVVTGSGDDVIIGSAASNELSGGAGNDTIRGGGGNDGLDGALGRDYLNGGLGVDSISGGGNVDTIRSQDRDRSADYVTCGSSIDSVNRDLKDQVAVDCETLT